MSVPPEKTLAEIRTNITTHRDLLDKIQAARQEANGYATLPLAQRGIEAESARALLAAIPGKRTFKLLAQGDSWFDYAPGTDLIHCLVSKHGHQITNIAVAGSTLNDEAYGPVPKTMFGLGPPQSDDPTRIEELVHQIDQVRPQALLLSAGGNDIAGDEFFSFINNARSGLPAVNTEVMNGVINGTFKSAYEYLVNTALEAATSHQINMPIFTHGYDYPWPDGRPVIAFLGWKIGPWFDKSFNAKNYPNTNANELKARHDIVTSFIDGLNNMLSALATDRKYAGKLFHVDLRRTLASETDWANELHPGNAGFRALADKIDVALQRHLQ